MLYKGCVQGLANVCREQGTICRATAIHMLEKVVRAELVRVVVAEVWLVVRWPTGAIQCVAENELRYELVHAAVSDIPEKDVGPDVVAYAREILRVFGHRLQNKRRSRLRTSHACFVVCGYESVHKPQIVSANCEKQSHDPPIPYVASLVVPGLTHHCG